MKHEWIRQSNLIENVDDPKEDARSLRAWRWVIKEELLTPKVILELHRKIMRKALPKWAGRLRSIPVWVVDSSTGTAIRDCPPYGQIPILLSDWFFKWTLGTPTPLDDWFKSAHVDFERIHPFVDGNGRVGRMILNWQRVKAGLAPLNILASERDLYYKWFETI